MKLFWYFLHIVTLSSFSVSEPRASSDQTTSVVDLQNTQRNLFQLVQKLSPEILPETKVAEAKIPTDYRQSSNRYPINPDSHTTRHVNRLSGIDIKRFKDVTSLASSTYHMFVIFGVNISNTVEELEFICNRIGLSYTYFTVS